MTDKIEPALSADEWKDVSIRQGAIVIAGIRIDMGPVSEIPRTIALANAVLPDSDPRKITWRVVQAIRLAAVKQAFENDRNSDAFEPDEKVELLRIADALESYLPPADG